MYSGLGYTRGLWYCDQNKLLIPVRSIIVKHSSHEAAVGGGILPYSLEELNFIRDFVMKNYTSIEFLTAKISGLIPDLSRRSELSAMLTELEDYTAPIGVRASMK